MQRRRAAHRDFKLDNVMVGAGDEPATDVAPRASMGAAATAAPVAGRGQPGRGRGSGHRHGHGHGAGSAELLPLRPRSGSIAGMLADMALEQLLGRASGRVRTR